MHAPADVVQHFLPINEYGDIIQIKHGVPAVEYMFSDAGSIVVLLRFWRFFAGLRCRRRCEQSAITHITAASAPVGNIGGAVRCHHNCAAAGVFAECLKENLAIAFVKAFITLVKQQQGRGAQEGAAKQQQTQLPLRKCGHRALEQTFGIKARCHVFHSLPPVGRAVGIDQRGVFKACEQQVAACKIPGLPLIVFLLRRRDKACHAPACQRGVFRAVRPVPLDAPVGGPQLAAHEPQQGGLARAVGANERAVRAAPHLPVDVVQHMLLAGIAGQKKTYVINGYDNFGHI